MTARARAPKTGPTPLGESIRAYATQYLSSGQKERAEGLAQAAMVVDDMPTLEGREPSMTLMNLSDTTLAMLRRAAEACDKELADEPNDFGDVGATFEQCHEAIRAVLREQAIVIPTATTVPAPPSGTPPLVPPPDVTSMVLSFGPDVYIQWPSVAVAQEKPTSSTWWLWDVWDRRGHTQGAHRIVTAVLYDRALAVARQSMNVTPQEALALANPTDPPR